MSCDDDRLLVDGSNVIGSRPDGWWRDRTGALERLVEELQPLAATRRGRTVVVVEGRAGEGVRAGRHGDIEVVHAEHRGRDAADDRIVALVSTARSERGEHRGRDTVVTADRALIDRVEELGAQVLRPSTLLARLHPGS